jgi:hypothetical protein
MVGHCNDCMATSLSGVDRFNADATSENPTGTGPWRTHEISWTVYSFDSFSALVSRLKTIAASPLPAISFGVFHEGVSVDA